MARKLYRSNKTLIFTQVFFDGQETAEFVIPEDRYVYLHVAKGRVDVNGKTFNTGDAARIREGGSLSFTNGDNAEIFDFRYAS